MQAAMTQKIHLHPAFCAKTPPMVGLIDDPRVGPTAKMVIASPRRSTGIRSAMKPGPSVPAPHTERAWPKRKMMNMGMSELTAQAIVKMRKRMFEA